MDTIVNLYYENGASKLHRLVDKVLYNLKFVNVDREDFYSLANEVFTIAIRDYDYKRDFNGFLYSCLDKKFKTEMTRKNRQKRQADKNSISLDAPVGENEGLTIGDMIACHFTIEKEIFENREEAYSKEMCTYLGRLSNLQKRVLKLISIEFTPNEILEELHINRKTYDDCLKAIRSYRNTSVLL